jgi:putative endonuclease
MERRRVSPLLSCPGLTRAPRRFQFSRAAPYFVYIMASKRNGTLYVGVTNNLGRRVYQHRKGLVPGFTKTYGVNLLVHYEQFEDIRAAIQREKNIKHWGRKWKVALIEEDNLNWDDLYPTLTW